MLAMHFQLERSQWWRAERIVEHQFAQLHSLVAHAIANTGFYRHHLAKAGLSGVRDLNPATFRRWPVLTRRQVQDHQTELTAAKCPVEHGTPTETFTSGSTGEPVRVLTSEVEHFFEHGLVLRDHLWHERDFNAKFAASRMLVKEKSQPGWSPITNAVFRTGPAALMDIATDIDAQLEWLLWEKPAYFLTTPSNLRALVERSLISGRVPGGFRQVITYAEQLPSGLRQDVRDAWHAELVDSYSSREFGALALQCPQAEHYHVQSENILLEVLRDDGMPCAAGESGRVVVTALHNFPMPLIRYELGDYAEVGAACACGRGLPVLTRIVGRVRNMAVDPTGRRFWPGVRPSLLGKVAPFRQVRLLQRSVGAIELQYVMERDLTAQERSEVAVTLRGVLGYPFEINTSRVPSIERTPGGKFEDFVSLLPPD